MIFNGHRRSRTLNISTATSAASIHLESAVCVALTNPIASPQSLGGRGKTGGDSERSDHICAAVHPGKEGLPAGARPKPAAKFGVGDILA